MMNSSIERSESNIITIVGEKIREREMKGRLHKSTTGMERCMVIKVNQ